MVATLIAVTQQAYAQNCEESKAVIQMTESQLQESFQTLSEAGAIKRDSYGNIILHPNFLQILKDKGVIKTDGASASSICVSGGTN